MNDIELLSLFTGWPPESIAEALAQNSLVTEVTIIKKGKPRPIVPPPQHLKDLLWRVHMFFQRTYCEKFLEDFWLRGAVQGFVPCMSPVTNAGMHLPDTEFFLCDLKGAFGQVRMWWVLKILSEYYPRIPAEMAAAIAELITYNGAIPQGYPTSPVFLNLACLELDRFLVDFTQGLNITFTRYADDYCLSTRDEPRLLDLAIPTIKEIIEGHFRLSPTKFRRLSLHRGAVEITGVSIISDPQTGEHRLGLSRHKLKRYRSLLNHALRDEVSPEVVRGVMNWVDQVYQHGRPKILEEPYYRWLEYQQSLAAQW